MKKLSLHLWEKKKHIRTLGIGEIQISSNPKEIIVTHSLGSCLGLSLYDPVSCIGGMIHCKLPSSDKDINFAKPAMSVEDGIPFLYQKIIKLGAEKSRLQVKLAGACVADNKNDCFKIGERNYDVAKNILKQLNLKITSEDCGNNIPRTLYLFMKDGRSLIRCFGNTKEL
jgi:chemotaxis protein CheD